MTKKKTPLEELDGMLAEEFKDCKLDSVELVRQVRDGEEEEMK